MARITVGTTKPPTPNARKSVNDSTLSTSHWKFWPKKPVIRVQTTKKVATTLSRVAVRFSRSALALK